MESPDSHKIMTQSHLMQAAKDGDIPSVKYLIEMGDNLYQNDSFNFSALDYAIFNKHHKCARYIFNHELKSMMNAAKLGDLDTIKKELQKGACINIEDESYNTPLLIAIKSNNIEVALFLISAGAYLNCRDYYGDSALINSIIYGMLEVTKALFYAGADTSIVNIEGFNARDMARRLAREEEYLSSSLNEIVLILNTEKGD